MFGMALARHGAMLALLSMLAMMQSVTGANILTVAKATFPFFLLLMGLLLVGLATGVSRQWLRVDLDRLRKDLGLPTTDQQDSSGINQWLIGTPKKSQPD